KDSLFEKEKTRDLAVMEAKYQNEKKQLEIGKLTKEKELQVAQNKKQKIIIGFIVAGLFLVLIFSVFAYRALHLTRIQKEIIESQKRNAEEANQELSQQNEEITLQHDLLVERNIAITEANELLQAREQELAISNATKNKFFSIISHDLRSPFNILLNLSELSLNDFDSADPEEIRENISDINTVANLTYNLLENLLQWAKIQTGQSKPDFSEVHINTLINEVFGLMLNVANYKKIHLLKTLPEDPVISVDQEMLKTVLRNLLSNAIKYTGAGGTIVIETQTVHNFLQVSIIDTGIGMSTPVLENLFIIGQNTSSPGTNNEKGGGLGLILCKEFVEINQGSIQAFSEEGKG